MFVMAVYQLSINLFTSANLRCFLNCSTTPTFQGETKELNILSDSSYRTYCACFLAEDNSCHWITLQFLSWGIHSEGSTCPDVSPADC